MKRAAPPPELEEVAYREAFGLSYRDFVGEPATKVREYMYVLYCRRVAQAYSSTKAKAKNQLKEWVHARRRN